VRDRKKGGISNLKTVLGGVGRTIFVVGGVVPEGRERNIHHCYSLVTPNHDPTQINQYFIRLLSVILNMFP
jgi:hypothetical protein